LCGIVREYQASIGPKCPSAVANTDIKVGVAGNTFPGITAADPGNGDIPRDNVLEVVIYFCKCYTKLVAVTRACACPCVYKS
jgi:hypothetical protein